ncbi:MAG: GNAT family N-acetyltransferase [Chitinophagaceae bacterium]|nr:GNAT family N-acetyltransferase [Chitinophagaceae bacterium]
MTTVFTLREWRDDDVDSLVNALNNKNISKNLRDSLPQPYTPEDAKIWIEKNKSIAPSTNFAIAINDFAVGAIGIVLLKDAENMNAELGYWLAENYWNQGIISEAVNQMVAYTFKTFPVNKMLACVFETNKISVRVLKKCGFKLEIVLKNHVLKNGVVMDEFRFLLSKPTLV